MLSKLERKLENMQPDFTEKITDFENRITIITKLPSHVTSLSNEFFYLKNQIDNLQPQARIIM